MSEEKRREVVQLEVAQQLIREKQKEIDLLNRQLELLVRAMLCSGLTVGKALENMEGSQPSRVHMEAEQIREYIQAYERIWNAEASFSEAWRRKQRSKRGWRGALRMLKAVLHR